MTMTMTMTMTMSASISTPTSSSLPSSSSSSSNFDLLFSQELIDLFIDHLSDSTRDLKSCSLVSYRWLPRTRKHLFQDLSVPCNRSRSIGGYSKFPGRKGRGEELTSEEIKERMRDVNELLDPLRKTGELTGMEESGNGSHCDSGWTLPLIAPFVRKLTLWADYSWGLPNRVGLYPLHVFSPSPSPSPSSQLTSSLLEEISIVDFFFTSVPSNTKAVLPEFLKKHQASLKSLKLEHLTFDSPRELVELLLGVCGSGSGSYSDSGSKCSPLRHLSIIDVNFHPLEDWRVDSSLTNDPEIASRRHERPRLETLEIACIPELLGPLFLDPYAFFDLSELKRLRVKSSHGNVYRYRRIFQEFGESIREVEIGFPSLPDMLATPLQPLNNLTHITLHSCFYTNQFHAIPRVIQHLPRHQHLTITSKFAFPTFPTLSDFTLSLSDDDSLNNSEEELKMKELREKEMQRVMGNILGNILTRKLDEELAEVFKTDGSPSDGDGDESEQSGGDSGTAHDENREETQSGTLPKHLVFAFEFPSSPSPSAYVSAGHRQTGPGMMKDKTCLSRTRSLKVVEVEVVCKTYHRTRYPEVE